MLKMTFIPGNETETFVRNAYDKRDNLANQPIATVAPVTLVMQWM